MKLRNAYLPFLMVATLPHGQAKDSSTQSKKDVVRVAREFVDAISTGKRQHAAALCWPERYDDQKLKKLVAVVASNKWSIESLDANEDVALVITSEIEIDLPDADVKKCGFSIEIRRRGGTWLVRDIDFEPPGRGKEKRKKFLGQFPDAKSLLAAVSQGRQTEAVKKLLVERLDTFQSIEEILRQMHRVGRVGVEEVHRAVMARFEAELDLADSNQTRIALLEKQVKEARALEDMVGKRQEVGTATDLDVLRARAFRLKFEVALERERETRSNR